MKSFLRILVLGLLFLAPGLSTSAQVTSSYISGFVHDDSAKGMPGAVIRAIHEPSGTTYGTAVNEDGTYTIQNLRVGGPYRVEVSYVGYVNKTFRDIFLNLGETYQLNVVLNESESVSLQDIIVSGGRNPLMNNQRTGATTNVGVTELQTLPTVSRSLTDMRLTHL